MRVLVIGGTIFVGRHIVEAARAAGHDVTAFHRGSSPLGRTDVEEILGDREHDLDRLAGQRWDVAIDTCGYVPRLVAASARALADAVTRYIFVSSVSAYAEPTPVGADESAELHAPPAAEVETVDDTTYGPLKVACERIAEASMRGRVLLVRPGLIVGPHDPTGRFPYWVHRFVQGGRVLVPATTQPIQLLDARDLGALVIAAAQEGMTGVLNAVGPALGGGLGALLAEVAAAIDNPSTTLVPVYEQALVDAGVVPWRDLPLWLGPSADHGRMTVLADRARKLGLRCRPIAETTADTRDWLGGAEPPMSARAGVFGLDAAREALLLGRLIGSRSPEGDSRP